MGLHCNDVCLPGVDQNESMLVLKKGKHLPPHQLSNNIMSLMVSIGDHSIVLQFYKENSGLNPFDVEIRIFLANFINTMAT